MKKTSLLLFILIVVVSCGSVKVSFDYDKTADFSSYKTFSFTDEALGIPLVDDINRNRILKGIEAALAEKGITQRENNADVLIDLQIKAQTGTTATATTGGSYGMYGGSYYGYGMGYPYGWGSGFTTTRINYNTYTDGTLFIDMIDAKTKRLVWQGRGTKTLEPKASNEKREQNLAYALKQIFMYYPPSKK
jgi:hypothetical protein